MVETVDNQQAARPYEDLQELLMRLWHEVRRRHLYPELPTPRFGNSESPAAMEMRDKQIVLNLGYVEEMTRSVPVETVLTALLDHGISHYTCCPWDLSTHLRLYARAKEILGNGDLARKATDLFMDVVADTHAVKERQSPLPQLYRYGPRTDLEQAVFSLYEKIWGVDLGGKGDPDTVGRLVTIPYLDKRRWLASLVRFIRGIRPLLEKNQHTCQELQNRMGEHGFQQYGAEEIERALRDFARESESPEQFADVLEDLQNGLQCSDNDTAEGIGRGGRKPERRQSALLYETGRELCPSAAEDPHAGLRTSTSSLPSPLGSLSTLQGFGSVVEFWQIPTRYYPDLGKARGANLRKERANPRLFGDHRFVWKHGRPSQPPVTRGIGWRMCGGRLFASWCSSGGVQF